MSLVLPLICFSTAVDQLRISLALSVTLVCLLLSLFLSLRSTLSLASFIYQPIPCFNSLKCLSVSLSPLTGAL